MIKINLLPVSVSRKKEKIMIQLVVGGLCILATLGLISVRWYMKKAEIERVKAQIEELQKEIAKREEIKKTLADLQEKNERLERQIAAIDNLDRNRKFFLRVLDKITESVPRNRVWLKSIKWGGEGRAGRGEGTGRLTIKGSAFDQDSIALFMGNLSVIPCDADKSAEMSYERCMELAGSSREEQKKCTAYKAEICIEKDEKCRIEFEPGRIEKNYEECRKYYKEMAELTKSCGEEVQLLEKKKKNLCSPPETSGAAGSGEAPQVDKKKCEAATREYESKAQECERIKAAHAKLHEEEFVRYDSVDLKYVKLVGGKDRKGEGQGIYEFELTVSEAKGGF